MEGVVISRAFVGCSSQSSARIVRAESRPSRETQQWHEFPRIPHRGRVTVSAMPSSSGIDEQSSRPVRPPALFVERTPADDYLLSKFNEELEKRTVKAEKGQSDDDGGPDRPKGPKNQLLRTGSDMETSMQIFGSTLVWILVFFIASVWDGPKRGRKARRRDRGDRS